MVNRVELDNQLVKLGIELVQILTILDQVAQLCIQALKKLRYD